LSGVGGEGFHIAPLSLCVECVEGKTRLAGARDSRDNYEATAWDVDIDVLQVVGASTLYHNPSLISG
jgi:hypothetical protein